MYHYDYYNYDIVNNIYYSYDLTLLTSLPTITSTILLPLLRSRYNLLCINDHNYNIILSLLYHHIATISLLRYRYCDIAPITTTISNYDHYYDRSPLRSHYYDRYYDIATIDDYYDNATIRTTISLPSFIRYHYDPYYDLDTISLPSLLQYRYGIVYRVDHHSQSLNYTVPVDECNPATQLSACA